MKVVLYSPKNDELIIVSKDYNTGLYHISCDMDIAYDIQKNSVQGKSLIDFDDFIFIAIEQNI